MAGLAEKNKDFITLVHESPFEVLEIKKERRDDKHYMRINGGHWILIDLKLFSALLAHSRKRTLDLEAAFEIKCDGILYQPEGCKMKLGTYKNGCGMCGKGNSKKCLMD